MGLDTDAPVGRPGPAPHLPASHFPTLLGLSEHCLMNTFATHAPGAGDATPTPKKSEKSGSITHKERQGKASPKMCPCYRCVQGQALSGWDKPRAHREQGGQPGAVPGALVSGTCRRNGLAGPCHALPQEVTNQLWCSLPVSLLHEGSFPTAGIFLLCSLLRALLYKQGRESRLPAPGLCLCPLLSAPGASGSSTPRM